ncbi:MAG: DNA topoisomerase VI, partial [Candidatus Methanomethylophilaceae archaeon]|nr:DNA topoisomerase VI [Candidatus Methanomethylophilaceae archaeon]
MDSLTDVISNIYDQLDRGDIPSMNLPMRSKKNIEFDSRHNVWTYGDLKTARTAKTVQGAVSMLRTAYTTDFINEMIREGKSSTLREMYYISEGWHNAKFHTQDESNLLAEDLETITGCMREDFKLRPEESGAHVYGDLNFTTLTVKGKWKKTNCIDDVPDNGFNVPYKVEDDTFKTRSQKVPGAEK